MSNNKCLVTNFLGEFQNDDLPVYNQAILSYGGGTGTNSFNVYIATGDGEVTVKSKNGYPFKTSSDPSVPLDKTEVTISANSDAYLYFAQSLGADPISELLTIIGMYNVKEIFSYAEGSILDLTPNMKNNIESMLGYAPLEALGGYFGSSLEYITQPESIKCINIQGVGRPTVMNIDRFTNLEKASYSTNPSTRNVGYFAITTETAKNTHLKSITEAVVGDIVNVPKNIKCTGVGTVQCSGSLNELVERLRSEGRTSGSIALYYPGSASSLNVTIDGVTNTVKNWWNTTPTSPIPHITDNNGKPCAVLSWDANDMWFASSIPPELTAYCNDYKARPTWES